PGADTTIDVICEFCSHEFKTGLGVGFDFISQPESYRQNIMEDCFLLYYYSNGGLSLDIAKDLPVNERKWYINRLIEEKEKKRVAEEQAHKNAKAKSKTRSK